ncbi:MAG: hypothetical protein FWF10_07405 [Clostridiales bacterium]|nr:hypothetical protein [Clostridiales bacterium]
MWKRGAAALLLILFGLLLLPAMARADVLIEPWDNDFYDSHRSDCVYEGRMYYANGTDGFVSFRSAPGSARETLAVENGERLFIQFTYAYEGEYWGVTEVYNDNGRPTSGWAPMEQLALVYDSTAFASEYGSEFYTYSGDYDALAAPDEVILWTWPGSGEIHSRMDAGYFAEGYEFEHAYTDAEGREWGYIGYWMGRRNAWVCIDAPTDENLPLQNPPPPIGRPTRGNAPGTDLMLWIVAGLVLVLVAGMVVVVWKLGKRRNIQ